MIKVKSLIVLFLLQTVSQASQQVISLYLTFYMVYHPFSKGSQKRFNKRYKSNITFSVRALHPSLHFIKLFWGEKPKYYISLVL